MHSSAHIYDEIKYLSLDIIHSELLSIFFLVLFNIKVFDTAKCCINNLFTFNEQLKQRPTIKKCGSAVWHCIDALTCSSGRVAKLNN